jgi:hypothetical protein
MRKAVAVALLLVPAALAAQWPTDGVIVRQAAAPVLQAIPAGLGTLSGKAVDRESSAPLPEARVIVRWLGPQTSASSFAVTQYGRVLTTDPEGAFVVPKVPYGNYAVEVSQSGYADGDAFIAGPSRRTMQVTDAKPAAAETFPLSRLGTLEGMVVDETGQPQADHAVMLYRRRTGLGPLLPEVARALTGDDGRFRFTHVPPSPYIVGLDFRVTTIPVSLAEMRKALPTDEASGLDARLAQSGVRRLFSVPTSTLGEFQIVIEDGARRPRRIETSDGRIITTASTYAPGVTSFAEADVHTLGAGQQLTGVNIIVRKQVGARVSGTLTGPPGSTAHVGMRLVAEGADDIDRASVGDAALAVTDAAGHFTFLGVAPGRYDLEAMVLVEPAVRTAQAMRPDLQRWAKVPVDVTKADIDELSVPLNEPLVVRGRVVYVTPGAEGNPRPVQAGIRVLLNRRSGQQASYPFNTTYNDGTFVLGPAFPGRYELTAEVGAPWRVLSIVSGGRDITKEIIDLRHSLDDVVITVTRGSLRD